MSKTATVEVLTAEVRVLMVGSRQVTLSVYNQLDEVPYDEIEPFGRVNPKDADSCRIYVVGKDLGAGALVRSSAWYWDMVREPSLREVADTGSLFGEFCKMDLADLIAVAGLNPGRYASQDMRSAEVRRIAAAEAEIAQRNAQREWMSEHGGAWDSLPLIVLAGLR